MNLLSYCKILDTNQPRKLAVAQEKLTAAGIPWKLKQVEEPVPL